jgi:hypothetical protein
MTAGGCPVAGCGHGSATHAGCDDLLREVDRLRARLAAVLALCDRWETVDGADLFLADVRAAARGEAGDVERPAS